MKFIPYGSYEHLAMSPKSSGLLPPGEYEIHMAWEFKPMMCTFDAWEYATTTVVIMDDIEHGNGD